MDRLEELKLRFKQEPLGKMMDATLETLDYGRAWVSVPIKPEYLIVDGMIQGGITTVIADFAGVYAAMSLIPEGHTPAAEIIIDFLKPTRLEHKVVVARAEVFQETERSIWVNFVVAISLKANIKLETLAMGRRHFKKPKPNGGN